MDRDTNRTAAENPASDAELAERARGAGPEADAAFAVLHNRHHGAALRHARRLEPDADAAEDLVSDAFVEVLAQLRRGGGPRESFRAYLCTTMRHSHAERAQTRRTVVPTDGATLDALGGTAPQAADALPDLLMVKQAFGSLPDRWQAVLWHTEVEGEKPRHIARLLGMTPNAVSQLAVRAREGLREAFLTAHIGRLPERCRSRGEQLGGYVRGTLRIRDRRAVDDHLADCPTCARLCAELAATNAHLRVLLLPAILGGTATAALTAEALAGGAAAAGTGSVGTASVGTGSVGTGAGPTGAGPASTAPAGSSAGPSTGTSADSGLGPAPAGPAPGAAPAGTGLPNALGKVAQSAVRKAVLAGTVAAATAAALALAVVLPGDAKPTAAAEKQADPITEPVVPPVRPPGPGQPATPTQPPSPTAVPSTPPRTPPNTRAPIRPESTPTVPGGSPAMPPPADTVASATPPAPAATGSPTPTPAAPPNTPPTTAATPSEPATTPPPSPTTAPTSPTPPVAAMAVDDSATAPAGGSVSLNLLANDRGEGLRIVGSSVAWGLYGRISCDRRTGACTYQTWTPLLTGTDVFHYTVRDDQGRYASATIRITVLPPSRA
ncbi:sigma-70 family RNA polymerase sigma factor [Yinghuangia sp. YIM S09857]|uniref:sigma-70 family RNA polymerase sigma factor n=1 Tax=Yinghuangia sp. YIM S09857 TaxID=3436929 RepID=UPI003F52D477